MSTLAVNGTLKQNLFNFYLSTRLLIKRKRERMRKRERERERERLSQSLTQSLPAIPNRQLEAGKTKKEATFLAWPTRVKQTNTNTKKSINCLLEETFYSDTWCITSVNCIRWALADDPSRKLTLSSLA